MKLEINQYDEIELREVYNTIRFVTDDGEELAITMRDSGFEFVYEGRKYSAQNGFIEKIKQKQNYEDSIHQRNVWRL